jgi:hypothetical protein
MIFDKIGENVFELISILYFTVTYNLCHSRHAAAGLDGVCVFRATAMLRSVVRIL